MRDDDTAIQKVRIFFTRRMRVIPPPPHEEGTFLSHHGASKIREYSVRQDDQINNQHFISIKLQISNNI